MYNLMDIENQHQVATFEIEGLDEDMNFKSKEDFDWWEKLADAYQYLEDRGININHTGFTDLDTLIYIVSDIKTLEKDELEVLATYRSTRVDYLDVVVNHDLEVELVPYFDKEGNEIYLHQAQDMYTAEELEQDLWDDPVYLGHIYNHIKERGE